MDLRSNSWFGVLLVLGCIAIIGIGVFGYFLITTSETGTPAGQKFVAEKLLYVSLCSALVFLLLLGGTIARGVRIEKRLDRLVYQSRYRRLRKEVDFRGFGTLGGRLRDLYGSLTDANEKLTRKLAAQGTLLELIVSNSPAQMLITDSTGTVVFASKAILDALQKEKQQIIGKTVNNIWEKIRFTEMLTKMEEEYQPVTLEMEQYPLTAYPVTGSDSLVAYIVFNAEKRPFFYTYKGEDTPKKKSSLQRELSKILNRRKQKGEARQS